MAINLMFPFFCQYINLRQLVLIVFYRNIL